MALSPMMKQYLKVKDEYPDTIVFFRLGDFYEMFFDDAKTASRELELTLTGRDCGLNERAPMCGVPYHAADTYLGRLVEKGYKVAICEQMSDPTGKGIVERDVVRVVTPGTIIDSAMLAEDKNNYLTCIYLSSGRIGVTWADISTGEINHALLESPLSVKLNDLLSRIRPAEILCNSEMLAESVNLSLVKFGQVCPFSHYKDASFEYENAKAYIEQRLGKSAAALIKHKECVSSCGALLAYVDETQKRSLNHLQAGASEDEGAYMLMDQCARKTLELFESSEGRKKGSLLGLIDRTQTGMGARKLRHWLEKPSLDERIIGGRLDGVSCLYKDVLLGDELAGLLESICDIERIVSKISFGSVQPKECVALCDSLAVLPDLQQKLVCAKASILAQAGQSLPDLSDLCALLGKAILRAPSAGDIGLGIISSGYDDTLKQYREIGEKAQEILAELERAEKESTGIKNLKISFNKVFGYYIEVSKSQLAAVPYRYIRKQTVATGERYITEELKTIEERVLNAEQYAKECEVQLYNGIIKALQGYTRQLMKAADIISTVDCITGFARCARERRFVRPVIHAGVEHIKITEGRHCMVESFLKQEEFVPNDTFLNFDERIMLITGPNMAGKSVYMRQVAIIAILAHIGCFVPAAAAEICLTDRVFTRVGASDDLSTGRSTFMVEMSEVSYILQNATEKSLILLDEIGRGTSTYDGLSIAWAIMEHLANETKAKTLFSTHYHELTDMEEKLGCVKNYKLTVREVGGSIVFLRKLLRGSANRSFGIEVAGLAGLPKNIIARAKKLLALLENNEITRLTKSESAQTSMFAPTKTNEVVPILKELNMEDISPRGAWDILSDLKEKVSGNE